jgi:hypothetical protein
MTNDAPRQSNMYAHAKTWNPFKGCGYDCPYCIHSFQLQSKRQKQLCQRCYDYVPHCHPDRLGKIPSAEIVFVAGNADISFCPPAFTHQILDAIERHNERCPYKIYYFQSKRPAYFEPFLARLPANVILVTTLETNRDAGYEQISKAPPPSVRYAQFLDLDYPRKVVTVEPLMAFDIDTFPRWIVQLKPEYVWIGLNSRPQAVQLPEPSTAKVKELIESLAASGIEVRAKDLRGIDFSAGNQGALEENHGDLVDAEAIAEDVDW